MNDHDTIVEELVAYLDGELDAESSGRVERRLASDEEYRQQLQLLQRSWDLLDSLPRAEVDETFTQSTVEMVAIEAAAEAEQATVAFKRGQSGVWLVAAVVALTAAGLGYLLSAALFATPNRRLEQDLAVIENLKLYQLADGVGFLLAIDEGGLFSANPDFSEREISFSEASDTHESAPARQRLAAMSPQQKELLRDRKSQFERLPPGEQNRLRKLHADLTGHPQHEKLRQILLRYEDWLDGLPSRDKDALLAKVTEERVAEVRRQAKAPPPRIWNRDNRSRITPDDLRAIRQWANEFVKRNEPAILAALPEQASGRLVNVPTEGRQKMLFFMLTNDGAGIGPLRQPMPLPNEVEIAELKMQLSPEARGLLAKPPAGEELKRIQQWLRFMASDFRPRVPEWELKEFRSQLPAAEQAQLDALPPEQQSWEVQKKFFKHRMSTFFQGDGKSNPKAHPQWPRRPFPSGPQGGDTERRNSDRRDSGPPSGQRERP